MYEELAIMALLVFLYSLVADRVERSTFSGPMVFVLLGFVFGPMVLGLFSGDATRTGLRGLADLTLALILFIDAANADLAIVRRQIRIPSRMLLLGLPGVIALGFGLALLLFDQLTIYEAAILGTMLAATDAALGKAVITNKLVPARVREGLNIESGLNDGLCVPVLLVFIALAQGSGQHRLCDHCPGCRSARLQVLVHRGGLYGIPEPGGAWIVGQTFGPLDWHQGENRQRIARDVRH